MQDLINQLKANPEISNIEYIPAKEGLKQLVKDLNLDNFNLSESVNPLPDVVIVQPILSLQSPLAISQLIETDFALIVQK